MAAPIERICVLDIYSMTRPKIVAVDGPAGSGKSSICATVCRELGWSYVNTGALYRAVGLLAHDRGVALVEGESINTILVEFASSVRWEHDSARLFVGVDDFTPRLESVEAATGASAVAKMQSVRDALLPIQRRLALSAPRGAIVDGRDIGTVVFPDADMKIFMTASLVQRAARRLKQLEKTGSKSELSHAEIMHSIALRDHQDSQRDSAPLKMADDAVLFDTSEMDVSKAINHLKVLIQSRGLA
jgi:cytidylate kinase